ERNRLAKQTRLLTIKLYFGLLVPIARARTEDVLSSIGSPDAIRANGPGEEDDLRIVQFLIARSAVCELARMYQHRHASSNVRLSSTLAFRIWHFTVSPALTWQASLTICSASEARVRAFVLTWHNLCWDMAQLLC